MGRQARHSLTHPEPLFREATIVTDKEVMEALRSDTLLNKARAVFSGECGRLEQACSQPRMPGPIEMRRMEFEAVRKIAAALGVEV